MSAAEAAREMSMFPGMIEMEPGVVSSSVMSDPFTVVMDVRGFGVALNVFGGPGWRAVRGWRTMLWNKSPADRVASAMAAMLRP